MRALPLLEHKDGQTATTAEEANRIWQQFASELEFGTLTTRQELWKACVERQVANQEDTSPPELQMIPTLQFLEACCRRIKVRKATGPDGLVSELFHCFPELCAKAILPLLMKILCYNSEPFSSKGGFLIRMWKGKGSISLPENFRGLLISNHLSKIMHAAFRRTLLPFYELNALDVQLGGQRGGIVTQAGHMIRAFLAWARKQKMPVAVIFLDIRTAFYRVIRPLVAQFRENHLALRALLQRFQLPDSAFQDLLAHLHEDSAVKRAGVSAFAEGHLAECHNDTWFEVPGAAGTVATATGTRPGDPLADMTFNFIFTRILRSMRTALEDAGLVFELEWSGVRTPFPDQHGSSQTAQLLEAVWADDLALVVHAFRAPDLLPRVRSVVTQVIDRCLSHALEPNLKAGKTEILVAMRGPGSVLERKQLFAVSDPTLEVESKYWGKVGIRIVQSYQHLGGRVTAKGDDGPEINSRFAQARSLQAKYNRSLFRNGEVSLEKRALLLTPLVLSVMQYGLGTWANFRPKVWISAKQKLHSMYRTLLRPEFSHELWITLSQEEVLARLQMPSLDVMAYVARLRHFGMLVRRGPAAIWAILEHEQSWLEKVREAGQWMWEQLSTTCELGPFLEDWPAWHKVITQDPKRFKGLLKRAQLHAILKQARDWATKHWHCVLIEALEPLGLQPSWRTQEVTTAKSSYICGPCQRLFSSKSAWSVHAFKKHGRVVFLRGFLRGTSCLACATEYWSTSRLLRHLQYMTSCAQFYMEHFRPGEVPPGLNSRHFQRNEPPVLSPPCDIAVPHVEPQGFRLQNPEEGSHGPLMAELVGLLDTELSTIPGFSLNCTIWALVEKIRRVLILFPMPFDQILHTWKEFFASWREMMEVEDQTVLEIWEHHFNVVNWRFCPAWLVPTVLGATMDNDHREAVISGSEEEQSERVPQPLVQRWPVLRGSAMWCIFFLGEGGQKIFKNLWRLFLHLREFCYIYFRLTSCWEHTQIFFAPRLGNGGSRFLHRA